MTILTPFRYPGSKNKLLPVLMEYIEPLLLNYNSFTDVFVGGGSVLLEVAKKYPNIQLYANDKDYWVYCFWKVVSDVHSIPYLNLLDLIDQQPTLEQFYKLRGEQTTDEVRCAYKAIYFNRTTFSGIFSSGPIGGKEQKSAYPIDCRYNSKKLRIKIGECRELLRGRTIVTNKDFAIYDRFYNDEPMYLDPPYYKAGNSLYVEKMTPGDHFDLAILLFQRDNWILSYDDCNEIRDFYIDYEIIDLAARYCINGKKSSWANKNELIILPFSEELKTLSSEEKDCFYDVKDRYQELYARYYQEYTDDLCDELCQQKYIRECVEDQEGYDKVLESNLEDINLNHSNLDVEDPNKW